MNPYRFSLADEQQAVRLDPERFLEIAASVMHDEHIAAAEVSIALVDDAAIQAINRRYLNHDGPTDVISFSLQEDGIETPEVCGVSDPGGSIEGEVIISGETAARQAAAYGATADEEAALYLVHGLLHLCGYDDQTAADRARMQQRQQWHLQKFGIRPNYWRVDSSMS